MNTEKNGEEAQWCHVVRGKQIYTNVLLTEELNYHHTPVMGNSGEQKAARMHQYKK